MACRENAAEKPSGYAGVKIPAAPHLRASYSARMAEGTRSAAAELKSISPADMSRIYGSWHEAAEFDFSKASPPRQSPLMPQADQYEKWPCSV